MSEPTRTTTSLTMRDLHPALLLATEYPDLPAAVVQVSPRVPRQLTVRLHGDPADFEPWRVALGIEPADVQLLATREGDLAWLTATVVVHGIEIELTAFLPTPVAPRPEGGGDRG